MVLEEEEEGELHRSGGSVHVVEIREGRPHSVQYSHLSKEDKENVLTDLLVKSAISHALEKQKQVGWNQI